MRDRVMRRLDRFNESLENFKRRRALSGFGSVDSGSRLFFERIVDTKKNRDFVFITKARSKNR